MKKLEAIEQYYKKKYFTKKIKHEYAVKKNNQVIFRIVDNLRIRTLPYIKFLKTQNRMLIGCNDEQLENHLKSKFTEGMTMENYGEWEVDHIMPISKFDLTNEEEIRKCFHYTNLQPLWMKDNRHKYNKIIT